MLLSVGLQRHRRLDPQRPADRDDAGEQADGQHQRHVGKDQPDERRRQPVGHEGAHHGPESLE